MRREWSERSGPGWRGILLLLVVLAGSACTIEAEEELAGQERESIEVSLCHWVRSWADTGVTLTVRHLRYRGEWAWVETLSRYNDGKRRDPRIDALLYRNNGHWKVLYVPGDDRNMSGEDRWKKDRSLRHFRRLTKGEIPQEIFIRTEKGVNDEIHCP